MTERQAILKKIGQFFLAENNLDYDKTNKILQSIGITSVSLTAETCPTCKSCTVAGIEIKARRVGYLIGRMGRTIEALTQHLGMKIKIIEDTDIDFLFPHKGDAAYEAQKNPS